MKLSLALLVLSTCAAGACFAAEHHFDLAAEYSAKSSGHAVLVMDHGKIVFEKYDNGHSESMPHNLHSATKTFWGPAIAAMIQDGLITSYDELACQTLPEWKSDPRRGRITLWQLLNLTAGLKQDVVNLQGDTRPTLAPDLYKHAVTLECNQEPGETFLYGPSCFYALGEIMKRKLAAKKQTPLDYLHERILDPIGCKHAEWVHDKSGNPHIPNGCHITAREWIKFGQLLVDGGGWQGKQLLRKDLLRFEGSKPNPGYGLTAWLNMPGGTGTSPDKVSKPTDKGGWVYRNGERDIYAAGGALGQRLYIVPSKNLTIVRFGNSEQFSDAIFMGLLFDGIAPDEKLAPPAARVQ